MDDRPRFSFAEGQALVRLALGEDLHAKRVLSLNNALRGVLAAASLSMSAIGRGLAGLDSLNPKHATKQIDRLLGNSEYDFYELLAPVNICPYRRSPDRIKHKGANDAAPFV